MIQQNLKELPQDVTIKREAKLQRNFRTLKMRKNVSGTYPAKIYGTPKMHKLTDSDSFPKVRAIVSSVGILYFCTPLYTEAATRGVL